jgi:hypothetical protein
MLNGRLRGVEIGVAQVLFAEVVNRLPFILGIVYFLINRRS